MQDFIKDDDQTTQVLFKIETPNSDHKWGTVIDKFLDVKTVDAPEP